MDVEKLILVHPSSVAKVWSPIIFISHGHAGMVGSTPAL